MVALEELEEELRTTLDDPDRAEAATRALVPLDESKARLMLRYQTTAENSLYRAYNALVKARKGREAAGEDREPVAPVVTVVEAPLAATGPLPNKANPADDAPGGPDGPLPNKANCDAEAPAGPLPNKANCDAEAPAGPLPNKANPAGTARPTGRPPGRRRRRRAMSRGGDRASTAACGFWAAVAGGRADGHDVDVIDTSEGRKCESGHGWVVSRVTLHRRLTPVQGTRPRALSRRERESDLPRSNGRGPG